MPPIGGVKRVPVWAGLLACGILSYAVNNFAMPFVPFFIQLPELGLIPYLTTTAGILGIWFALRDDNNRAAASAGLCVSLGLLTTAVGFIEYMRTFASNSADLSGLQLTFVGTAQGLFFMIIISFLLLWSDDEDEEEEDDEKA